MRKIVVLFIIIVLAAGAGFFYLYWDKPAEGPGVLWEDSEPPKLFSKEDYKVEERDDGIYVVVEKVGLTAKVPNGWEIKIEGDDYPESEYWVNLLSPEAEMTSTLTKGCAVTITVQKNKEAATGVSTNINTLKQNPSQKNTIKAGYEIQTTEINGKIGLKWRSTEQTILGFVVGVDFATEDQHINISTRLLPEYEEQCEPIWQEFLANLEID